MAKNLAIPVLPMQAYGGEKLDLEVGRHRALLVRPSRPAANGTRPWVWFAPTFLEPGRPIFRHDWYFTRLLASGFFIAGVDVGESYGNPEGRRIYHELYQMLTREYGLAPRACLMPQSRGGLMLYNWAAEHPQHVQCIGGIYPVCDLASWPGLDKAAPAYGMTVRQLQQELDQHNPIDRLEPLARRDVPIFHIHGDADTVVPLERNSAELARRYQALGGMITLEIVAGKGHAEIDEFFQSQRMIEFFLKNLGKKVPFDDML